MDNEPAVALEGSVTDADLDAAAVVREEEPQEAQPQEAAPSEPTEEPTEQEPIEEAPPEEPKTDEWRDGFEKRQRKMEGHIGTMMSTLQEIKTSQETLAPEPEPYEYPSSMEELDALISTRINSAKKSDVKAVKDYEEGFLNTITDMQSDAPQEDKEGIEKELWDNFNVRHTDNAPADAAKNYAKASRAYYQKKTAQPLEKVNPLKGEAPVAPLGGATTQTVVPRVAPSVQLDQAAQDFVNYAGMDDEKVAETLGKPMPSYLGGR